MNLWFIVLAFGVFIFFFSLYLGTRLFSVWFDKPKAFGYSGGLFTLEFLVIGFYGFSLGFHGKTSYESLFFVAYYFMASSITLIILLATVYLTRQKRSPQKGERS